MSFLTDAQVSSRLRQDLKEAFPGTKFSVRTTRGSRLQVEWENGPSREDVEKVAQPLITTHDPFTGSYRWARPTVQTKDGEVTGKSLITGLSCKRTFSMEILEQARDLWVEHQGMAANSQEAEEKRHDWMRVNGQDVRPGDVYSQIADIAALLVTQAAS